MASGLRIGVVAGEASGDILGSRVIAALRSRCSALQVEGIGGPLMQAQGLTSMFEMERLSVMGFAEPIKRLPELLRMRRALYRSFCDNPPDVFLGIDSPDFNLHLEHQLRRTGVKTAHLVSPSVWAWRRGRIRKIRKSVDLMLCLFPFESAIYARHGVAQRFVGHPLADEIAWRSDQTPAREALGLDRADKLVAILPGSRATEIHALAPLFLEVAAGLWQQNKRVSFVIPAANRQREKELEGYLAAYEHLPITVVRGRSAEAMAAADVVLLASGTATLEAALLKRPMVVAYRMGAVSWFLLSRLVHSEHIALPNLLAGRQLVPELLQKRATPQAVLGFLGPLLSDGGVRQEVLEEFDAMHQNLRRNCAEQVADALLELAAKKRKG
jgi:lipid-A-disaccharide synthase